jgi:endoglucanase
LSVVDFQTPLLAINQQLQANDKTASIIGKDRVHPGEQGHLVMSHAFLKAQGLPALVTGFSIDVKRKNHEIDNCQLKGDVNISGDKVNFSCTAGALPFPMNEAQTSALALVPFQQDLNQQILRISNLSVGSYKLLIDKKEVGQYSHTLLSKGVNLSDNSNTPMYQQALVVKSLNDKRAQLSGKLRGIALIRYSMLSKYPDLDMNSKTHVSDTLYAHVEKSAGKPWYGYLKSQVKEYLKNVEQKQLIQSEINVLFKKIAIENNPKQHYWEIIKM